MSEDDSMKRERAENTDSAPTPMESGRTSTSVDRLLQISLKSMGIWTAYIGGVLALVVASNKLGGELGVSSHLIIQEE